MSAKDRQVAGSHYKSMGVEPWDVVDTWPIEQQIGAYRHGALKYLMRMGSKDERLQEIQKGLHYLEKLVEILSDKVVSSPTHPSEYYPPRNMGLEEAYDQSYKYRSPEK